MWLIDSDSIQGRRHPRSSDIQTLRAAYALEPVAERCAADQSQMQQRDGVKRAIIVLSSLLITRPNNRACAWR